MLEYAAAADPAASGGGSRDRSERSEKTQFLSFWDIFSQIHTSHWALMYVAHSALYHTCKPREKFWRDKRGAIERSEPTSEGGSGGPSPKIFKNLHCKWCNLCYS